jgi:hypothetical protein
MVAAKTELNRIAKWSATNDFNLNAIAESHFEQSAAKVMIAADRHDASFAADAELIQTAAIGVSVMIADFFTGLLHNYSSCYSSERSLYQNII